MQHNNIIHNQTYICQFAAKQDRPAICFLAGRWHNNKNILLANKNIKMKHYAEEGDPSDGEDYYNELPAIKKKQKRRTRPISANLIDTQYEVVQQVCWDLDYNIVYEKDIKNWDVKWTDSAVTVDVLNKLQSHQKINHFPGMNTLSRKNNLAKNLSRMQEGFPEMYDYFPKTFMLPSESSLLRTYYNESKRRGRAKTYIIKPEASCQGRGIFLSQNLEQIQAYGQCVVQTYIDRPLLYKGLKFDMRIYALVAGCDPLRAYIYNQGLVRFATEKYQHAHEQNLDNMCMHLTNYAINKENPKYVFNQSLDNLSYGHKKSLAEFFQTLKGIGLPAHQYWSSIKQTIVKTLISGQPHLQHEYRMAQQHNLANNMCFEILGFDFMIDDRNKVYLLEINYTPSFSTETPLDHLIKSNLIRDSLVLMNVTPEARDQALKTAKEVLDRRVYTGKMTKHTPEQRERIVREHQKARDEYEKKNLGSFEKIYPSRNQERQARYEALLQYSLQDYKLATSPQKYVHSRRSSSKYRIKKILSNNTICDEDRETRGALNVKSHPRASVGNPELSEVTALAKKLKEKLNYGQSVQSTIFHEPDRQKNPTRAGRQDQVKVLNAPQTSNGQSTMFSKQCNVETAG